MRVLSNVCFVTDDGKFLRKITFQIVTSVVDQQGNNIPIVMDKLGQTVTVNPRFVRYIIASNNKESIQVNVVMCEGDDSSQEIVFMPQAFPEKNSIDQIYVHPFNLNRQKMFNCQYWVDNLGQSLRVNSEYFYGHISVPALLKNKLVLGNYSSIFSCVQYPPINSLVIEVNSVYRIECVTYWDDNNLLAVLNKGGSQTLYCLFPSKPLGDHKPIGMNVIKILYTINGSWSSRDFAVNSIIRHKGKLYHFNKSNLDDKGNPSGMRILNISGGTISGHIYASNGTNKSNGKFWPTNLFSTKHGLVSLEDSVARMIEYSYVGGSIKVDSISLSNPNYTRLSPGSNFSTGK